MKLAEALLLRADYKKSAGQIQARISQNLKVQEGADCQENPQELMCKLDAVQESLKDIIIRIEKTNMATILSGGKSIAQLIVEREDASKKRDFLQTLVRKASEQDYRLARTELKMTVTIPVKQLQKKADEYAKAFRVMDTQLQAANWTVELL